MLQQAWYMLKLAQNETHPSTHNAYIESFWTAIEAYYNTISQYEGFQCGKGCAHCCYDNPHGVSALELERIIPLLSKEQIRKIQESKKEYEALPISPNQNRQQEWKKKCIPCPLLSNHSCSVYHVRPLACRSFFSEHDPRWCHPLHGQYQEQPQIGHDDIHSLLQMISIEKGTQQSSDLISGLYNMLEEIER